MAIPPGYAGVIHAKSGLAMEGIIAITGIIDTDFCGEIGLMMHNVTMTDYKVLKENPLAQLVVYKVDRLPVIYHASGQYTPKSGFTGGACREKGFGEVTALLQAKLTDDLSDCKIPCSGTWVHELWQPSAKATITSGHKLHTTVPTNTKPSSNHSISTKKEETDGTSKAGTSMITVCFQASVFLTKGVVSEPWGIIN